VSLQARLEKLERAHRARRATVEAAPGAPFGTLLMLSAAEACDLACEQAQVLCNGGDFAEVTARFNARMDYLRKRRGAADGNGK